MSVGVASKNLLKVLIDLAAVVELSPKEGGGEQVFFHGERLPHISFFEGVLDGGGVVAR